MARMPDERLPKGVLFDHMEGTALTLRFKAPKQ